MRKLFAIILALALALSLAGCAAAEEPQNDATPEEAKPFEGMWMDDRAVAQLIWEEEGYRIQIRDTEGKELEYSGFYHADTNTVVTLEGEETFSKNEEGLLVWKDLTLERLDLHDHDE